VIDAEAMRLPRFCCARDSAMTPGYFRFVATRL